jgi:hypothetical protein
MCCAKKGITRFFRYIFIVSFFFFFFVLLGFELRTTPPALFCDGFF